MSAPLPIVFCSDANGVTPQLEVALWSLLHHAGPDTRYHVYVLSNGVTEPQRERLRAIAGETPRHALTFVETADTLKPWEGRLPCFSWTITAWTRCFMETLLPDVTGRLVYLDIDTYVCCDLTPLFETDLRGKTLGAVCESRRGERTAADKFERLNMPPEAYGYFNSGILLVDFDRFRALHTQQRLLDFTQRPDIHIYAVDQDALNGLLWDDTTFIHPRWNWSDGWFMRAANQPLRATDWRGLAPKDVLEAALDPGIIHFSGPHKPWVCNHRPEGWRYAEAMRALGLLNGPLPGTTLGKRIQNALYVLLHAQARLRIRLRLAKLRKETRP